LKNHSFMVVLAAVAFLSGCATVNDKLTSYEPQVVSLGTNRFSISYYAKNLPDAGARLETVAKGACKGKPYDISDYKTQDFSPVYVAVDARIACK